MKFSNETWRFRAVNFGTEAEGVPPPWKCVPSCFGCQLNFEILRSSADMDCCVGFVDFRILNQIMDLRQNNLFGRFAAASRNAVVAETVKVGPKSSRAK
ncbi:hypothetical protein SAMN05421753_108204 [Planctomicrobium piriforme]|uniref:Uncharacterized protein n=1 Tax=Planctomicrobium piriforme TaxID=1576369 RepID=A0A1I3HUU4_9PLAN|nr:hypothetical protein SAMN05421753_108204 [Planctomicrobium piriforme]